MSCDQDTLTFDVRRQEEEEEEIGEENKERTRHTEQKHTDTQTPIAPIGTERT